MAVARAVTGQKFDPHLVFKIPYLTAERRLRRIQASLSRLGETARLPTTRRIRSVAACAADAQAMTWSTRCTALLMIRSRGIAHHLSPTRRWPPRNLECR